MEAEFSAALSAHSHTLLQLIDWTKGKYKGSH